MIGRVVTTTGAWGREGGYFASEDEAQTFEDELKATVILQPGATLTEQALFHWAQEQLAYFAVPRFIEFVDALPVTENGKVQKFTLRDRGVTAATWDREAAGLGLKR